MQFVQIYFRLRTDEDLAFRKFACARFNGLVRVCLSFRCSASVGHVSVLARTGVTVKWQRCARALASVRSIGIGSARVESSVHLSSQVRFDKCLDFRALHTRSRF